MDTGMNSTPVLPLTTNYPGYQGSVAGFDIEHGLNPGDANLVSQGATLTHQTTHANADGLGKLTLAAQESGNTLNLGTSDALGKLDIVNQDALGKLQASNTNSLEHIQLGYGASLQTQLLQQLLGQNTLFLNETVSRNSKENAIEILENRHRSTKEVKEALASIKECIHNGEINALKTSCEVLNAVKDSEIRNVERLATLKSENAIESRFNRLEMMLAQLMGGSSK